MATELTKLKRYPIRTPEPLQAWDSADELILSSFEGQDLQGKRILIVNDHFGALSLGLSEYDPTTYTDSYVSHRGMQQNGLDKIMTIGALDSLEGNYDVVVIQIPKNMSYFEDILCRLTPHLTETSKIICGAMVKHLSPTSFDLLQKYIGPTRTGLAKKKARLVFADYCKERVSSPYPIKLKVEGFEKPFINHSNLFSREKLDIGTRFFLDHIPAGNFKRILDLGCANGIIGIRAKERNPGAEIFFSDDSFLAIESARVNYKNYFTDEAHFFWLNCFEGQPKNMLDLVLCNPPFHQENTVGDFIAWQMFQDAHRSLKPGGALRIIGNSHLGYQVKLKKIFGNFKLIATNEKFMIVEAVKA